MSQNLPGNQPVQPAITAELQREWSQAAEKIFGSAMSRPDVYQRVTTLVGLMVADLRDRREGTEGLLAAWEQPNELMQRVLTGDSRLSGEGLDVSQVVAATCSMRYREVLDEQAAASRLAALAAAADPDAWVMLLESGPPEGDPFLPYRRLEAQPSTGLAIAVSTNPDERFIGCVHSVDVVSIDTSTGEFAGAPAGAAADSSFECQTQQDRESGVARIKQVLGSATG